MIFVRDRPSNCQSGRVLRIVGEGQVLEAEEALKRVLRVGVQMRVDLQPSIIDILAQGVRVSLGKTLLVPLRNMCKDCVYIYLLICYVSIVCVCISVCV